MKASFVLCCLILAGCGWQVGYPIRKQTQGAPGSPAGGPSGGPGAAPALGQNEASMLISDKAGNLPDASRALRFSSAHKIECDLLPPFWDRFNRPAITVRFCSDPSVDRACSAEEIDLFLEHTDERIKQGSFNNDRLFMRADMKGKLPDGPDRLTDLSWRGNAVPDCALQYTLDNSQLKGVFICKGLIKTSHDDFLRTVRVDFSCSFRICTIDGARRDCK